jgi:cytochrome c553
MPRREFTKQTKRDALRRSGLRCESIGEWYGHAPGHRCNADLSKGVQYDHIDLDANSKDNSLGNCAAVCIACHRWKTAKVDVPKAAKTLRQQDKDHGIEGRKQPIPSRNTLQRGKRASKPPLPPRALFGARS